MWRRAVRSATLTQHRTTSTHAGRSLSSCSAQLQGRSPGRRLRRRSLDWPPSRRGPWLPLAGRRSARGGRCSSGRPFSGSTAKLRFVPPKTHRSTRSMPLLQARGHRADGAAGASGGGPSPRRCLPGRTTAWCSPPTSARRWNRGTSIGGSARHDRRPGLEWVRLHDLRHAFATFLLDQGEELRTVMDLLGHSTIRLTADTYGHVLPSRARSAADAIDRVLGGGK